MISSNSDDYIFNGNQIKSLPDFVIQSIQSYESWELAKIHLENCYLQRYFESIRHYDVAALIEFTVRNTYQDFDLALLELVFRYRDHVPFAVYGKIIDCVTIKSVCYSLVQNVLTGQDFKIAKAMASGHLSRWYLRYIENDLKLNNDAVWSLLKEFQSSNDLNSTFFWMKAWDINIYELLSLFLDSGKDSVEVQFEIGNILFDEEKYAEASIAYLDALLLDPHHAESYYSLAFSLKNLSTLSDELVARREEIYRSGVFDIEPNIIVIVLNCYSKLHMHDEAIAILEEQICSSDSFDLDIIRESTNFKAWQSEALTTFFNENKLSSLWRLCAALSQVYFEMEDKERFDPETVLYEFASQCYRSDQMTRALDLLGYLLDNTPNDLDALELRGLIYYECGQYSDAISSWRKVVHYYVNDSIDAESTLLSDVIALYIRACIAIGRIADACEVYLVGCRESLYSHPFESSTLFDIATLLVKALHPNLFADASKPTVFDIATLLAEALIDVEQKTAARALLCRMSINVIGRSRNQIIRYVKLYVLLELFDEAIDIYIYHDPTNANLIDIMRLVITDYVNAGKKDEARRLIMKAAQDTRCLSICAIKDLISIIDNPSDA